ncbi:MAG: Ig-like domain-containing protein [archaeon]|nr:Ig-like domain-containing protein [archaeon]
MADDASADSSVPASVTLEDYKIATEKSTIACIQFKETDTNFNKISWTAKLINSNGSSQSGALDKTSGSSSDSEYDYDIKVTAPKTAGTYTLVVSFTETFNNSVPSKTSEVKQTLNVMEPITLSVTVSNSGSLAVSDAPVYFYVDGKKIEDSKTTLTVAADSSATLTYKYFDKDLSSGKHTYYVLPADEAHIEGLSAENSHSFYYNQGSQDYMVYIMIVIVVLLLIVLVVVYRRPVKNYGKPKARR